MSEAATHQDREMARSMLSDDEREALELDLSVDADDSGQSPAATVVGVSEPDAPDAADDDQEDDDAEAAPVSGDGADDDDEGTAGDGVDAKNADVAPEAEPPAAAPAAPSPPVSDRATAATYQYQLPADFEAQRKALDDKFSDLNRREEAGELTVAEYGRELRALTREEARLDGMAERAEMAREMAEQAQRAMQAAENAGWAEAAEKLFSEIEADSAQANQTDYRNDQQLGRALGEQVQVLMSARGGSMTTTPAEKLEMLRRAHAVLQFARTGQMPASQAHPPAATPAPAVDTKAAKRAAQQARKPDLQAAPPALSTLPGTDAPTGEAAEFANLLELQGEAMEDALQKLKQRDPAKYERFLAGEV